MKSRRSRVFHGGGPGTGAAAGRRRIAGDGTKPPRPALQWPMPPAAGSVDPRFVATRRVVFGIVLASFVLSFFHRTAPAAIAGELTRAFAINSAVLGTLAATYFYVYTLLQIPVGVLADTLGPRVHPRRRVARRRRRLARLRARADVGDRRGRAARWSASACRSAFIAILKISAVWFPANRFATLNGVTMFAGNLRRGDRRRAARVGRHADVVAQRCSSASALLSIALAAATWRIGARPARAAAASRRCTRARRRRRSAMPLDARAAAGARQSARPGRDSSSTSASAAASSPSPACGRCRTCRRSTACRALRRAAREPAAARRRVRVRWSSASSPTACGSRRGVMRAYTVLYALSWLPWLAARRSGRCRRRWRGSSLMGLLIPGFTLSWTVAKEVNRPEHSGIATSVVNVGIFLGTGILQPLVGFVLDRGRAAGDARRRRGTAASCSSPAPPRAARCARCSSARAPPHRMRRRRTDALFRRGRAPDPGQNSPTMRPSSRRRRSRFADGSFGRPGIVITSPQIMHDELGAGGEPHLADVDHVPAGRAAQLRIGRERVLRLGDAHREVAVALVLQLAGSARAPCCRR